MIDWDKFNDYLQYYDKKLIREVIDIFIRDYPQKISTLRKSVEEKDFPELDIIAHTLKSNCAIFGDMESKELALKLELMGKNHVDEDMNEVFGQFVIATGKLIQELEQYRNTFSL